MINTDNLDTLIPTKIKKVFIESYGCQMNMNDSEIVVSILQKHYYQHTKDYTEADLILLNTCSIREKAEVTIRKRLTEFKSIKKQNKGLLIGILGCMAERLKEDLLVQEKLVDLVVGPDAYRTLPQLIKDAGINEGAVNVLLSREETYSDIAPVRLNSNGVSAFVSIMRGCNNMCTFCVVPFTRGRERSRPVSSIVEECKILSADGYKEITLLGQNVDSYNYIDTEQSIQTNFAQLLAIVASINPNIRIRFSTSHPKDITDEVLFTIKQYANICKYIHLPIQSGNSRILELMNRTYDRDWYIKRFNKIKEILPDCGISTDIISGFCSETEAEHQDTIAIMELCKFNLAYMYSYSERPGTYAERKLKDDVPESVKAKRLQEIIDAHRRILIAEMMQEIGKTYTVLIEGDSKRDNMKWFGRNEQNKVIVFPKIDTDLKLGDYIDVTIVECTSGTLIGQAVQYV